MQATQELLARPDSATSARLGCQACQGHQEPQVRRTALPGSWGTQQRLQCNRQTPRSAEGPHPIRSINRFSPAITTDALPSGVATAGKPGGYGPRGFTGPAGALLCTPHMLHAVAISCSEILL